MITLKEAIEIAQFNKRQTGVSTKKVIRQGSIYRIDASIALGFEYSLENDKYQDSRILSTVGGRDLFVGQIFIGETMNSFIRINPFDNVVPPSYIEWNGNGAALLTIEVVASYINISAAEKGFMSGWLFKNIDDL